MKKEKLEKPQITVWRIPSDWHPFPWRFSIRYKRVTHEYHGIPNQCATELSAKKRAWWRAKWLMEGTYSKKYIPMWKGAKKE